MKIYLSIFFLLFGSLSQQGWSQQLKKALHIDGEASEVLIKNEAILNSPALDFSPAYLQNGIVFPSAKFSAGKRDKNINTTFFELFYADLDPNHQAYKAHPFSTSLNSTLHEGPVCFSKDGNAIYFTRNNMEKGLQKADKSGVTRLKIYQAQRGEFDWENIEALPFNEDHYSIVHPTLDHNTGRLYFSSNMVGGSGGYDLYYCQKEVEGWGEPQNLGPNINSAKNELFPFFHSASQQLFFASNGYDGQGGLDIYMISAATFKDGPVINLGEPFNSPQDDLGIIINSKGTKGFFSSARNGGLGKDDIYSFESSDGIFGKTRPINIPMMISTSDAPTNSSLAGVAIRIFEKKGDGYYRNGRSLFEAVLLPLAGGGSNLVFKATRRSLKNLGAPEVVTDVAGLANYNFLSQHEYTILASKSGYEILEFPFATLTFPKDSMLLLTLSPKTCQKYNGFVKSSLTNGPVPNALIKVTSDVTKQEELLTTDGLGRFTTCLNIGEPFSLTAYKDGFQAKTIRLKGVAGEGTKKVDLILEPAGQQIAQGAVLILENIYYDFNKYNIRAGAAQELSSLAQLMRIYPNMEIILTAHTDSRGNNNYNLELSKKRAMSARNFLINRGIKGQRININGLGETQLRNQCRDGVKCSELEHQYNRRTEVVISRLDENVAIRYELNDPEVVKGSR